MKVPVMFAVMFLVGPSCVGLTPQEESAVAMPKLVFSCAVGNDLYCVLTADGAQYPRYDSPAEAVRAAPRGAGVLILAAGYPEKTTDIEAEVFDEAAAKKLRLYVEFPTSLPGTQVGRPAAARKERGVVASARFGEALPRLSILAIHDCQFVGVQAAKPSIVLAQVAGYDTAVFGLKGTRAAPILFEHSPGSLLVATTKLSQFVTARYAPRQAWRVIWRDIMAWLQPAKECPIPDWAATVRPSYELEEKLPGDAFRTAIARGVDWHSKAKMLVHESWMDRYGDYTRAKDKHGPAPGNEWPAGDGTHGVLEGVASSIRHDGTQPVRWWLRTDSNGESSLAFALRWKMDGDAHSRRVAGNLLDWVYFRSGLFQQDESKANFGLVRWAHDSGSLYGDNDIRIILGCMGTAALLGTDRWDERLVANILGNFRTTGALGYRGNSLGNDALLSRGWRHYWSGRNVNYAPHYQAWIWASYLWLYDKTHDPILLDRTRRAVEMMMQAYPDRWRWTNGIQQERGRMLLTLAWLVRVDDRPEYRAWLKQMAEDMRKCQDASGAIREELGDLAKGGYRPPQSNAEYGRHEASLIQENGDPVADLLYTCNFAFLGLHEAHASTGDTLYKGMADRLAEFLVRVQVRSELHPELDGGWFRAFDFEKWDYWGSNADAGWGAWSIEVGWTQAWIPTVLAMRELDLNLWDLTGDSRVARHWKKYRKTMLAEAELEVPKPTCVQHAAVGRPVKLAAPPDPRYPGAGAAALANGRCAPADHMSMEWLGYQGGDLEATIDLGASTALRELGASFLQSTHVGIFLPKRVVFSISEDGRKFRILKSPKPDVPLTEAGPLTRAVAVDGLEVRARYVRIRAENVAMMPDWHSARGKEAWLFVDEIFVNP